MALDLEKINIARKSQGLEPLLELPKEKKESPEGKTAEEIEAERLALETDKNKSLNSGNSLPGELDDAALLALLEKRGVKVSSLEELKPKEAQKTPEEILEERDNQKLTYAIGKGLFNKKEYESFISDNNDKENLVYANYYAEAKKDDPELTDEDIEAEFKSKFGLDAEPGSRKHKRGAKEINLIAGEILKTKHNKIYDAENKYSSYENETKTEADRRRSIASKTPDYVKTVNEVFSSLSKIAGKFDDQESYEVTMVADSIEQAKKDFLTPEFVEKQILAGLSKEQIEVQARSVIVNKNLPYLLREHAKQILDKHKAGTKGIVPLGEKKKETDLNKKVLTKEQQLIYDEYLASQPKEKAEQN